MARNNVRVQKRIVDKKEKRHVFTATIPERLLKELGWKEGTELKPQVLENILVFRKVKS